MFFKNENNSFIIKKNKSLFYTFVVAQFFFVIQISTLSEIVIDIIFDDYTNSVFQNF